MAKPRDQAPRPALSRADETLAMWNEIGNKLVAMALDFSEDNYDFKLQKDERTFAENLLHVAAVDYDLMRSASGSNIGPDFGKNKHNPSRDAYKTKADVVKLIPQAVADGANLIQQQGETGLDKISKYAWGNKLVHNSYTWMFAIEHSGEHHGSWWCTTARTTWCRRTRAVKPPMNLKGKHEMQTHPQIRNYLLWSALILVAYSVSVVAQTDSGASKTGTPTTAAERDGQHDFDFELGSWKIHLKRRLHPLTGSNTWVEIDGTSVTRRVWDGRSQLEEFETEGAGGHIEGLTLRTYNPQTHQWSLYWANSKDGTIVPPQVGQFKDGCGEFYGQDTLNGKLI